MFALAALTIAHLSSSAYTAEIEQWRARHEAALKAEDGWPSVAGLYWLKEGESTMGTDRSCDIVLPSGSASGRVGTIAFRNNQLSFKAEPGVGATIDSKPVENVEIRPNSTRIRIRNLAFVVIRRGKRTAVRLFDNSSPGRTGFTGENWFPIDERYRIEAKFVPYATPKSMPITNVLGDTAPVPNPGYVEFTVGGKLCRLEAEDQGDSFFFNFRDSTTGKATYAAGRFLDAPKPKDGIVILDFNKAENPPCAFTDFATCPLPPKSNFLKVAIPAGEKIYRSEAQ